MASAQKLTNVNIGISEQMRGKIAEGLSCLLADTYSPVQCSKLYI
jgi:hypothetical protein